MIAEIYSVPRFHHIGHCAKIISIKINDIMLKHWSYVMLIDFHLMYSVCAIYFLPLLP